MNAYLVVSNKLLAEKFSCQGREAAGKVTLPGIKEGLNCHMNLK
jgi:hypothetical protein